MADKILVLGQGFIGERLKEALNCSICGAYIGSFGDAERIIKKYRPRIIINCIGAIGKSNVDDCERDIDGVLRANTFIPIILAEIALRHNIKLVHISSGCIFRYDYAKDKPIKEEDNPDFFDLFYSRSKIYAERSLSLLAKEHNILIARIRIPLFDAKHPRNILDKLIKYGKVIDIPNSVTYIPDFVKAMKHLISIDAKGIYNLVNKGALRYPELLDIYKKYVPDFEYQLIDYKKLGLVRTNLLMSTRKLEESGFKIRNIHSVLEECVRGYLKS